MTTYIILEDGRVFGATNGLFDAIVECAAQELEVRPDAMGGLQEWLLDERCEVRGSGIGYLDLRELAPRAAAQFKAACMSAYRKMQHDPNPVPWIDHFALLIKMWISIANGEPPEALTSSHWRILPWNGDRRGPGWE